MIGFILAILDVNKIIDIINNPEKYEKEIGFMYSDSITVIKSLTLDLVAQLQPDMILEELADQTVKNLIFIARILKSMKNNTIAIDQNDEVKSDKNQLSLSWLVRKLRKAVNKEITQTPKSITVVNIHNHYIIFI